MEGQDLPPDAIASLNAALQALTGLYIPLLSIHQSNDTSLATLPPEVVEDIRRRIALRQQVGMPNRALDLALSHLQDFFQKACKPPPYSPALAPEEPQISLSSPDLLNLTIRDLCAIFGTQISTASRAHLWNPAHRWKFTFGDVQELMPGRGANSNAQRLVGKLYSHQTVKSWDGATTMDTSARIVDGRLLLHTRCRFRGASPKNVFCEFRMAAWGRKLDLCRHSCQYV